MEHLVVALLLVLTAASAVPLPLIGRNAAAGDEPSAKVAAAPLKRPFTLPVLRARDRCPVTQGSRESVPREPYIFCAGCLWFGAGPVYLAWTFQLKDPKDAVFSLDGVPRNGRAYFAKTPWVSLPDYSGPILIRGRQLDGKGILRFSVASPRMENELDLNAPNRTDPNRWSFWPSSMSVPGPGCYGIQIDTSRGTDIVIFRATTGD